MEKKDTRFKKGEINNPNGRPKGSFSLTELLKRKLQEVPPGIDKRTYAEQLIDSMFHKGLKERDHASQKLIMNYVEGLPKQSIEQSGSITVVVENFVDKNPPPAA